jgi:hypothetical protein
MKPLNLDNRPCSPISSNCVVWQGPTLDCIGLCNGDTISDVVANMATELCTLLDQTNVVNYDLTCLGITACGPKDFQALIQLLIDKICDLYGIDAGGTRTTPVSDTCPSCVVTVASCLRQTDSSLPATMELVDYVQILASKICILIDQIGQLQLQINNLNIRVSILEDTPPPVFVVPTVTLTCTIDTLNAGTPYPIDIALQTITNSLLCPLTQVLGTPEELGVAIRIPCSFDTDVTSNPDWIASPLTLAESLTDVWIVLCTLYSIVSGISLVVEDTNTINLNYTGSTLTANIQDTGWQPLNGFDHYAPGVARPQCRRIGNEIHFKGNIVIPLDNPTSPGNVVSYTGSSYNSVAGCQVFTGGGGVVANVNGFIQFNNATSVIPTTVLDAATDLDDNYSKGIIIATRQIDINATYGTALSATLTVSIGLDKTLRVGTLKDLELTNTRTNPGNLGTSHLRYITSNVRTGEYVPDFINVLSTVHNSPNSGSVTTTTVTLPAPLAPDTQYQTLNNLNVEYNTFTYPFDCNAGDENQIGGFIFKIDGLIGYVDPCTKDIKQYICA